MGGTYENKNQATIYVILTISSLGELTLLLGTSAEDGPGLPPNNVLVCVVGRPPNDVGVVPGCVT
jgi:hypothetical protein